MTKKYLSFAGLLLCAGLVLGISTGRVYARLTGTDPGTDVWCVGQSGVEICVDASGNILPTTTAIGSLGTSALKFTSLWLSGNASVGGTLAVTGATTFTGAVTQNGNQYGVLPSTQTVTAGATINTSASCGGLLRLATPGQNVTTDTTNTLTTPTQANTGCRVILLNTGGGTITLDNNANFLYKGSTDLVLGTNDSATVVQASNAWTVIGTQDN